MTARRKDREREKLRQRRWRERKYKDQAEVVGGRGMIDGWMVGYVIQVPRKFVVCLCILKT